MVMRRFTVVLATLDPTVGSEMRKTRPCLIISPDDLNQHLDTLVVAPMTTGGHRYRFRVPCRFQGKDGQIALDQIRTIDRSRIVRSLGTIVARTQISVLKGLTKMFSP